MMLGRLSLLAGEGSPVLAFTWVVVSTGSVNRSPGRRIFFLSMVIWLWFQIKLTFTRLQKIRKSESLFSFWQATILKNSSDGYRFYLEMPGSVDDEYVVWLAPGIGFIKSSYNLSGISVLKEAQIGGKSIHFD